MAYTTVNNGSLFMNAKLYTGDGAASHAITGVGFQPDWVWLKNRSGADNNSLNDVVRGANKNLVSNNANSEATTTDQLMSFNSDGFTVGASGSANTNGNNFVGWNWKANGTGSANTAGSINSTVSVNTTSGFSIVSYTGDGYAGATVGHGLGAIPKFIIVKKLSGADSWTTYHASLGATKKINFDTGAAGTQSDRWNDTSPTDTLFSIGTNGSVNASGATYIAYCFADVQGYQSMGSFIHNGASGGPAGPTKGGNFIYLGFRPALILIKNASATANWLIQDIKRSPINVVDDCLFPDLNSAESANYNINFLSNGFKLSGSGPVLGSTGNQVIYYAVGQSLVGTNNIPNNAF